MLLVDVLASLDAKRFERLCRRRGVRIDERKRLSDAEQAARQLADWARVVRIAELPEPARSVAHFLATHGEGADRRELGGGVLPLMEQDLVFAVPGAPERVAMPADYRVQLAPHPGEDRASARALLAMQSEEVQTQLGAQLLGRRPVGPAALWLGRVLERLESPKRLEALLGELSPKQRRLLEAVEARGGQLETDELLELEKSPVRVQLAGGAALPTRSASHQLFVRGLLLPRARGLWAVPTEVAERVGAARRAAERARRRELLAKVAEDEDLSPARARLGEDPGPATVALLAALDARGALPSGPRAVRRSVLEAVAREVGVGAVTAEMLVVLARAAGARTARAELRDLGALLFRTWREGGAWDEARVDADVHRAREEVARAPTPTRGLREVLLELLEAMPAERFAPVDEVSRTAARDLRNAGAVRLLERAAGRRRDAFEMEPVAVVRRVALESLPGLGAVDRGRVEGREVIRLSIRARRWLAGERHGSGDEARWAGGGRLRVGGAARVGDVLAAAAGAHALVAEGGLSLRVDADSAARGLERRLSADELRERLEALASPLDPAAERALVAAERDRVRVRAVAVSALLPIEDPALRERVASDPELREMLLAEPFDGGLLVRAGVPRTRLARALARLGITLDEL
jgi:hypothetical protein